MEEVADIYHSHVLWAWMGDAVARGGNVELLPVDDGSIVALQKRCNNILGCDLATNRRQDEEWAKEDEVWWSIGYCAFPV